MGLMEKSAFTLMILVVSEMLWICANNVDDREVLDYREALRKAVLFLEGQRSGRLPSGHRVQWRGDSGVDDGLLENVDLEGGYYDAGDNVKFGWPMFFTTTLLSWAAVDFPHEVATARQMHHLQSAIQWATNFILKAHTSNTTLYTQVGEGNSDHQCWERPEDMDTPRTLYKITSSSPGTEAAADASAALAASSMVFQHIDQIYSSRLLNSAKLLFEFANGYRGSYQGSCPFYCSYSGYQDELLWAATWLYRATKESKYLEFVVSNVGWSAHSNEFNWDNKYPGVQVLLAKEFMYDNTKQELARYKNDADSFVCSLLPSSSTREIQITPGGLLFTRDSANLQYVATSAFTLLFYSNALQSSGIRCGSVDVASTEISTFAKSQVDYILGKNPQGMSYMVGFGDKYPTRIHHRGSSIPSVESHPAKISCGEGFSSWFSADQPNPNLHIGAIVGGPKSDDRFEDVRSDSSHLEPTTYMNAAFVGAAAALISYQRTVEISSVGADSTGIVSTA